MSSKHLTLRMDPQLFEEIEALKSKGVSMSSFLVQLIEQGMKKPESVYEERAAKEMRINYAVNTKQLEGETKEERNNRRDQHNSFQLNQGHITFTEIIEKHKVELEQKYG